jgi:hypothetical protein
MCVCPVSDRLKTIFSIAGKQRIPKIVPLTGDINWRVVLEIRRQYRTELNFCAQLFEHMEDSGEGIVIFPEDSRWNQFGFDRLSGDERRLIRRICELDKHPCSFTENGLILSPKVQRIHPLARPSDFASALAS